MAKLILTLLAIYTTSLTCIGQLKSEDVKVDLRFTGFKFATRMDDMVVYLPNGKVDLNSKGDPSSFSIHTEPNMDYDRSMGYIDYQIKYSTKNGILVSGIKKSDTTINGNRIIEVTFTETIKEIKSTRLSYYAIMLIDTTAIIFLSGDSDKGKYIKKFRQTFRSLKI